MSTSLTKDKRSKRKGQNLGSKILNSSVASPTLKERSKASIQQKWDAIFQKYRDIKDTISCTGKEAIQNDWEFYKGELSGAQKYCAL